MKTYIPYLIYILMIVAIFLLDNFIINFLKRRWISWLIYAITTLLMILFLWHVSPHKFLNDFNKAYYPAGRIILENPGILYEYNHTSYKRGFVNFPIIAYLFTPFSYLDLKVAQILFLIVSIFAIIAACYVMIKCTQVSDRKKSSIILLFAANGPMYHSVLFGNITHFLLLMLLAALFSWHQKRQFLMGIILAVAALIKIPLYIFGVYFLLRGQWRALAGFVTALMAIAATSVLLFGMDLHLAWFHTCIQPYSGKSLGAFNVQSLDAFLIRLTHSEDLLKSWVLIEGDWVFKLLRYILLSLIVGSTIWICWRSKQPNTPEIKNLEFSIVLCLALVISPLSWTHYYLLLLLPISLYMAKKLEIPEKQPLVNLIYLSALLISLPVLEVELFNPLVRLLVYKVLISHYLFGGLLLLGILLYARWQGGQRLDPSQSNLADM